MCDETPCGTLLALSIFAPFLDPAAALIPTLGPLFIDPGTAPPGDSDAGDLIAVVDDAVRAAGRSIELPAATEFAPDGVFDILRSIPDPVDRLFQLAIRFVLEARSVFDVLATIREAEELLARMLAAALADLRDLQILLAELPERVAALRELVFAAPALAQIAAITGELVECVERLNAATGDPGFRVTVILGPEDDASLVAFREFVGSMIPLTAPIQLVMPNARITPGNLPWTRLGGGAVSVGLPVSALTLLRSSLAQLDTFSRTIDRPGVRAKFDDAFGRVSRFWTGDSPFTDPQLQASNPFLIAEVFGGGAGLARLVSAACAASAELSAVDAFDSELTPEDALGAAFAPQSVPRQRGVLLCPCNSA